MKEYAWVIQRDDGKYCLNTFAWCSKIFNACMFGNLKDVEMAIKQMELQNCKPIKIEIKVVEDDQNTTPSNKSQKGE